MTALAPVLAAAPVFGDAATVAMPDRLASFAVADVNRDKVPDLIVTANDQRDYWVALGRGDGTFGEPTTFSSGDLAAAKLQTADFNGDGNPDIALADQGDDLFAVALGNGHGSFNKPTRYPIGRQPVGFVTTDLNNDGHTDVALADLSETSSEVTVLLGKGDGTFLPAQNDPLTTQIEPDSIASSDINHDGKTDVIIGSAATDGAHGHVLVLLGTGTGNLANGIETTVGQSPASIAAGDFNKDGHTDLAVGNESPSAVQILLGDGMGHMTMTRTISLLKYAASTTTADLNGDGNVDIAVASADYIDGPPYHDEIAMLFGNGAGGFTEPETHSTGIDPRTVRLADVNGDGKPDVLTGDGQSKQVSVFLNSVAPASPEPTTTPRLSTGTVTVTTPRPTAELTPTPTPGHVDLRNDTSVTQGSTPPRRRTATGLYAGAGGIALGGAALAVRRIRSR